MSVKKASFSIILDKRNSNAKREYPIKLRVTYDRKPRTYAVGHFISEENYLKLFKSGTRDEKLKDIKIDCHNFIHKAEQISNELEEFSFEKFKKLLFPSNEIQKDLNLISSLFNENISNLKTEGRVSTYQSYQTTLNSLEAFKPNLKWEEVTKEFLGRYERAMLKEGKTSTSIGIYLRSLRAIYNMAIERFIVPLEKYPFGKKKYKIPAGRNIKKALTLEEISQIFKFDASFNESYQKAKDFFILSYLCNGLNIKDICQIKNKDIEKNKLTVIRAKTALTTKSNQKPIQIILHVTALEIINKYRTLNCGPDSFVFPFLQKGITPEEERKRIQNLTKTTNKFMKRIGVELGIEKHITTYTARHSYSTVLKRSGVSTEYISESLGHSDLKTTESYLDSFEDSQKKEYSSLLTKFD